MEQCEPKNIPKNERGSVTFKYSITFFLSKHKNTCFYFLHQKCLPLNEEKKNQKPERSDVASVTSNLLQKNNYGLWLSEVSVIHHSLHIKGTTLLDADDCNTVRCDLANRPVDLKLLVNPTKLHGQGSALKDNIFQSQS